MRIASIGASRTLLELALVRGAGFMALAGVVAQCLGAATGLMIARWLGPQGYGHYASALALASAFLFAFLFGLDSIVARQVAQGLAGAATFLSAALLPAILWSLGLATLICCLAPWLGYSAEVRALLLFFAPAMGLRALVNLLRAGLRGLERLGWDAFIQFAEAVLVSAFALLALWISSSVLNLAVAFLVGETSVFLLALVVLRRLAGKFRPFRLDVAKKLIARSLPVGLTFVFVGINLRLEMVVLAAAAPAAEIGKYAAALGVVMFSRSLTVVSASFLPRLANAYAQGMDRFRPLFKIGLLSAALLGLVAGLVVFALAGRVLALLFGPDFVGAAAALRVLAIMSAIMFINTYFWQVLIAMDLPDRLMAAVVLSLVVNGFMSFALIPILGSLGAALAALGRELCQFILMAWFVFNRSCWSFWSPCRSVGS